MAETLKNGGGDSEWLERADDGLSPEQRREKGQMDLVMEGIMKEVEQREMEQAFEAMGRPENVTVAEVRDKTDFQEAPKVLDALKEITAGAEAYARENATSLKEGLEQQMADYETRVQEADDNAVKEAMIDRMAWSGVLLEGINDIVGQQGLRVANGDALPGDVL